MAKIDKPTLYWVNQYAVDPTEPGGTRHYEFATELNVMGWDNEIITSDFRHVARRFAKRRSALTPWPLTVMESGVRFRYLWTFPYQENDWRRMVSMVLFGAGTFVDIFTRRLANKSVVVGSSPHLFGAWGAMAAAKLRRKPFVFEVRDMWPESYAAVSGASENSATYRLLQRVADHLYRHADAIVVLAEPNRSAVAARGVSLDKIFYVPNSVSLRTFVEVERKPRGDSFTFVYAGAHGPANGLDVVIEAAARLTAHGHHDLRVILIGDGPAKPGLIQKATDLGVTSVEFRDPIPKTEIPALFGQCDAGLMILANTPLFATGVSPNKLFDYLAVNLPIVCNVEGLVAEIVRDANAGLCCTPGNADSLAEAMILMADDVRLGRRTFNEGRRYIEDRYNRVTLATHLDKVCSSLLA